MKIRILKAVILFLLVFLYQNNSTAQPGSSKYGNKPKTSAKPSTKTGVNTSKPDTTKPDNKTNTTSSNSDAGNTGGSKYGKKGGTGGNQPAGGSNTDTTGKGTSVNSGGANVYEWGDTTVTEGIGQKPKKSFRNGGFAIKRNEYKERVPLAWEDIRDDDAVYSQIVWREIDAREKMNLSFIYKGQEDNGDQRFISILFKSILEDSVVAFVDERFTEIYTKAQLLKEFAYSLDTVAVFDPSTNTTINTITKRSILNLDSVYKFRIKEQYVFDKESSRMHVRIIGVCPVARMKLSKSAKAYVDKPMFWIYYPDLRASLAKAEAYNPKNYYGRMTWEEIFENRFFSGYIYKSTLNNPTNQTLANLIKDPLFRLLEGENIKEKLFNYEQDLWSY